MRVMPFGLCNAPSSSQRYVNAIFSGHVDKQRPQRIIFNEFLICFLDDTIILSKEADSLMKHVEESLCGLEILDQNHLYVFALQNPNGARLNIGIISGLQFNLQETVRELLPLDKIKAVMDWLVPRSVTDMRRFLSFCNCFRKHLLNFSKIARPLYDLTKHSTLPDWKIKQQQTNSNIVLPTQPHLNRRQASWSQVISPYFNKFTIIYRKGSQNDANALLRRPDLKSSLDKFFDQQFEANLDQLPKLPLLQ
jgi:hypothetical protein